MNLIDKVLQEEMMIEDTHTIIDSDFSFVDGFMNEQDEAKCDKDIPPEEEEDFCNSILDDDDQESLKKMKVMVLLNTSKTKPMNFNLRRTNKNVNG